MSQTPAMNVYGKLVDLCIAIAQYAHHTEITSVDEMAYETNRIFELALPILWMSLPPELVTDLRDAFIREHLATAAFCE